MKPIFSVILLGILLPLIIFPIYLKSRPSSQPSVHQPSPTLSPIPPPRPQFVSQFNHGRRDQPNIALTFDADMTPSMLKLLQSGQVKSWYNSKIVDILHRENIPATIFITGMWAELYPDIIKQLAVDPLFEIANHSYSHPGFTPHCFTLTSITDTAKNDQIDKPQQILSRLTGQPPQYFRFPGGCQSDTDVKLVNSHGLTVVGWDVASTDAFNTNQNSIVRQVETKTQNGSIIVFHFHGNRNAPRTADALEQIIPFLKNKGFHFVKISDLIAASQL